MNAQGVSQSVQLAPPALSAPPTIACHEQLGQGHHRTARMIWSGRRNIHLFRINNSSLDIDRYSPPAPAPRWHVKENATTDWVANSCHRYNTSARCEFARWQFSCEAGMRLLVSDFTWTSQFIVFALYRSTVKCSQWPIGVNAATDVSAELPAMLTSTYGVTLDCRTRPQSQRKISILTLHNNVRSRLIVRTINEFSQVWHGRW